jgi:hypothetical protein
MMRWARNVERLNEIRTTYKILVGKHSDLGVDGMKMDLEEKQAYVRTWIGINSLPI